MSDVKIFFEEKMMSHLKENQELVEDINATYQFNIEGAGNWFVDLTTFPPVIEAKIAEEADCTIGIKADDLMAIAKKELNGQMAFMTGKLAIDGNFGLALKLESLLDFEE
ncbi:SCP2 sterol-binding domain-containing protein [bacterium]|nr:SCP2 sterol-binding domain-containing protein [bacterium]